MCLLRLDQSTPHKRLEHGARWVPRCYREVQGETVLLLLVTVAEVHDAVRTGSTVGEEFDVADCPRRLYSAAANGTWRDFEIYGFSTVAVATTSSLEGSQCKRCARLGAAIL